MQAAGEAHDEGMELLMAKDCDVWICVFVVFQVDCSQFSSILCC